MEILSQVGEVLIPVLLLIAIGIAQRFLKRNTVSRDKEVILRQSIRAAQWTYRTYVQALKRGGERLALPDVREARKKALQNLTDRLEAEGIDVPNHDQLAYTVELAIKKLKGDEISLEEKEAIKP